MGKDGLFYLLKNVFIKCKIELQSNLVTETRL
jgi:hypothetical protein